MKGSVARITGWARRTLTRMRQRWPVVDHAWRTKQRYSDVIGSRLAAGSAYYGFFAVFAFGVVLYSLLGYLVEFHADLGRIVDEFLSQNIPVLDSTQIAAGRGTAGVFGLVGLLLTGLGWVESVRSSQRLIWSLEQQPGSVMLRRLIDVAVLAVLGVLLIASFVLVSGVERWLDWSPALVQTVLAWVLAVGVNLVLAVALLVALPRVRLPARRLAGPALAVAVGLLLLNTLGTAYVTNVQQNPAYAVVAVAAGLLVYLYLFHQLLLWAATWAATGD